MPFNTKQGLLFIVGIALIGSALSYGQQIPWEFAQDKEGIEVYTRSPAGSKFKEFRGITEMELSLHSAVAVLSDIESMPDWVSDCESTRLLSKKENRVVYHMVIGVPFPFDDRDMVQELTFNYNKVTGSMEIILDQIDEVMDPLKGIIRMPIAVGKWTFDPIGENNYKVVFEYLSDPGGALPAWLVNSFLIRMPYKTMVKFRERVNTQPYNSAHFDWLGAPR